MENENTSQQPAHAAPASPDASGAGPGHQSSPVSAAIQRGSDAAVNEHVAEGAARRGRGRPIIHGKYSSKVPVAEVGAGAGDPLLEENPAGIRPLGWTSDLPAFDREAAAAGIDAVISGLEFLGQVVVRLIGRQETPDDAVIKAAVDNAVMPDQAKANIRAGGVKLAEIHAVNLKYFPYGQVGLGILMWGGVVGEQVKTLKDQGKKLREAA
jgi:hypothetical protein